jgi:Tfp pilus assembly protein PilF
VVREVQPTAQEVRRGAPHTPVPEAYHSYLDARYFLNYRTLDPRNGERAAQKFEESVAKDPDFSDAWAGLADAYIVTGGPHGLPAEKVNDVLRNVAARALALDPTSPDALAVNGTIVHHLDYNWALAERYLRRAVQIQPQNAAVHLKLGALLSEIGRINEAIREYDMALDLDPLSPSIRNAKGLCLFLGRRYVEAKQFMIPILETPQAFRLYPYLGAIYLSERKNDEALAQYAWGVEKANGDALSTTHLAYALAKSGRKPQARVTLKRVLETTDGSESAFFIAAVYSALEDNDEAFHWLDRAYADREWSMTQLNVHPYFDDLRRDSRFALYLKRLNFD